jgi:CRP/FNR family transcriptional regulator
MLFQHIDDISAVNVLSDSTKSDLRREARRVEIPADTVIFRPGDLSSQFPLVASGSIRVQRVTENGREIVLYRVAANETCILTTASLITEEVYSAEAIAETDIVAYLLSDRAFKALLDRHADFRHLVFKSYGHRISELMSKVEEIVCLSIDKRLAQRLLELVDTQGVVRSTQNALAADLATAREVIGRSLKTFFQAGWVSPSRGEIEIIDKIALQRFINDNK